MAGGKETPRQKMIGMMYLFLTALLALNVSKEIINAFVVINKGLEETNSNFASKLHAQYAIFEAANQKNPGKTQAYYDQAKIIRAEAAKLIKYLTELKARIVATSEDGDDKQFAKYIGKDRNGEDTLVSLNVLNKKDDYDSPTNLLIGGDPSIPKKGDYSADDLIKKVQAFRDVVNRACGDNKDMVKRFNDLFAFGPQKNPDGKEEPWGVLNFYHSPVVASIAVISKLQGDVKNAESDAIEYLLTKIDATDIKINRIIPVVDVKSNYIAVGDSLVASIYVGAIDTTRDPKITVQGRNVPVRGGRGYMSERPTSVGDQLWKGVITYDTPSGEVTLPFEIPFKVAASTDAVIDPSAMNVLYIGIDNPIDVAVPGADKDKLVVNCNNSKVSVRKGEGGRYMVKPTGTFGPKDEVEISVSGETSTGGKRSFGVKKFRVKSIPPPLPEFGGKGTSDATISLIQLKNTNSLKATLKDFVFDGVEYKVTGFTMSVPSAGGLRDFDSSSNLINPEMRSVIDNMRKGQFITFVNIKAVGPDGRVRTLPNLFFKITG